MKNALLLKTAVALALTAPMLSMAESQLAAQGANSTASARLDVRVIIPRVLFLGVGTGAGALNDPLAANGTVSTVTFDYTTNPQGVGGGTANPAGAITGAVVPVRVVGNNGTVSLVAATTGALTNATNDTIPWTQISATSSAATLPAPVIPATGSGTAVPLTPNVGTKVTRLAADWTFSYANSAVVAPGTYGTTNGQITYTASMP